MLRDKHKLVRSAPLTLGLALLAYRATAWFPDYLILLIGGWAIFSLSTALSVWGFPSYYRHFTHFYANHGKGIAGDYASLLWRTRTRLRWMWVGGLSSWHLACTILLFAPGMADAERSRSRLEPDLERRAEEYAKAWERKPVRQALRMLHAAVCSIYLAVPVGAALSVAAAMSPDERGQFIFASIACIVVFGWLAGVVWLQVVARGVQSILQAATARKQPRG